MALVPVVDLASWHNGTQIHPVAVLPWPQHLGLGIVLVAVGEHKLHSTGKLLGILVITILHILLESAEAPGVLIYVVVIMQTRGRCIHWLIERPGIGSMLLRQ